MTQRPPDIRILDLAEPELTPQQKAVIEAVSHMPASLEKALQALQWLRGPNRWILESPQHLEQLVPLQRTFPDATIAITHRDPVSVIASTATMLAYGSRVRCNRVDLDGIAAYWIDRIERLLRACVRDREKIPVRPGALRPEDGLRCRPGRAPEALRLLLRALPHPSGVARCSR